MNTRIKELRNTLYLSHEQFAKSINISLNNLIQIEIGIISIPESIVDIICKNYHVNEQWLKQGIGPIFDPSITIYENLKRNKITPLQKIIINAIINLDPDLLNEIVYKLHEELKFLKQYLDIPEKQTESIANTPNKKKIKMLLA
ncbi:helix-turn-helix domain-containing protein [Anaeromicropila herbilytica]|uniref:HTH cro/C1-type domain-containing protein n=1 Tax=Anaeromicropila herbilytica TaxID=2785025 RepID=A0A7R7EI14_9FIRM|nr:helix-turn-helix domain-containing protein [Anaeromicropila herbilytica]BCN29590.1 hypothetical protein bsdtb5_08850 [Anaeromicropila herbilytica]